MSWMELSGDYVVGPNKTYKLVSRFKRTEGTSSDSLIEAGLNSSMSNAEIEDKIYKETGDKVKVLNRFVQTEVPGAEYTYTVVFDSQDTHSFTLLAIGIIIVAGIVAAWFLVDKVEHTSDTFFEEGMAPAMNIGMIAAAVIVIIVLLKVLKS
jgi:hypothetical protein